VTNSSDRTLRQFILPAYPPPNADREYIEQELEPTHRFNDPISRTAWHAVSYSPDGEWLAGGEHPFFPRILAPAADWAARRRGGCRDAQNLHMGYFE